MRTKIQKIKQSTNEQMTYTDVMNQALDFWINSYLISNQDNNSENDSVPPPSYQKGDKDETSAKLFLCTNSSITLKKTF